MPKQPWIVRTAAMLLIAAGCGLKEISSQPEEELFVSEIFVEPWRFTPLVEGPACDREGNLYAVGYGERMDGTMIDSAQAAETRRRVWRDPSVLNDMQMAIGKVTSDGESSAFVFPPKGSLGNGIRFNSEGSMLIADWTAHNILEVDIDSKEVRVYAHEPRMNQPNDIAIGANDILYASDPNWRNNTGQLWRIDTDGAVTLLEADMGTTNGIEVSPDGRTLYVNESAQRNLWAYDLSPEGEISNKRLLMQFSDFGMDGMRCDVDGNLYIARYGKGTVVKVSPEGEVLLEVALTGQNPSNIAFGGSDGRTCYVTLADRGNIETFRADRPGRSWTLYRAAASSRSLRRTPMVKATGAVFNQDLAHYTCYRTAGPIEIDGKLDEPSWEKAPRSEPFVDIVTGEPGWFETRVALLWDETYLYFGFTIPETDVWGTLTERDARIYLENDVEVFVAGEDAYYEFEINALNTIYEVFWIWKDVFGPESVYDVPEWDLETQKVATLSGVGGHTHPRGARWGFLEWDFPGLRHAVHVDGTLNQRDDLDKGWTVELALPWRGMKWLAEGRSLPPNSGDIWRIDCSRFQKVGPDGELLDRSPGWAWNKHGHYDSHIPETFTHVHFSTEVVR